MKYTVKEIAGKVSRNLKSIITGIKNLFFRVISKPLKPKWVVFMVTDRCNSRCLHCNIWAVSSAPDPLNPAEIKKAFSDNLFKEVEYVLCTGGEPSVREDLEEIILSIHRAIPNARIQLSTNALLPERVLKVVKSALKHGINLDVGVSLDGIGEEHDRLRGVKGNFDKADRLLRDLVNLKKTFGGQLSVAVGIVISDLTLNSLEQVRAYSKGLDIDITEAWYNESTFYKNISKHVFSSGLSEAVKSQPPSPLKGLWLKKLKGRSIKFPCFAMHTFCVLKCNGDIAPCLNLFDISSGNVREKTPTEIWHSDEMKKVRTMVKNCEGCLNGWGVGWSFASSHYQNLFFSLKRFFTTWG